MLTPALFDWHVDLCVDNSSYVGSLTKKQVWSQYRHSIHLSNHVSSSPTCHSFSFSCSQKVPRLQYANKRNVVAYTSLFFSSLIALHWQKLLVSTMWKGAYTCADCCSHSIMLHCYPTFIVLAIIVIFDSCIKAHPNHVSQWITFSNLSWRQHDWNSSWDLSLEYRAHNRWRCNQCNVSTEKIDFCDSTYAILIPVDRWTV